MVDVKGNATLKASLTVIIVLLVMTVKNLMEVHKYNVDPPEIDLVALPLASRYLLPLPTV